MRPGHFCGSELTCQETLSLQDVGARVLLKSGTDGDGALGRRVIDVELDEDAERFEFSHSGCQYADMVSSVVEVEPTEHLSLVGADATMIPNACTVLGLSRAPSLTANNSIDNSQDQAFLAAFYGAKEDIKVEAPNVNDDVVKAANIDAVRRGVEVRIITSNEFNETSESFVGGPNGQNLAIDDVEMAKTLNRHLFDADCERAVDAEACVQ